MAAVLLSALLTAVCWYVVARHTRPVVYYLAGRRVRHRAETTVSPPSDAPPDLSAHGFRYLGDRTETLGPFRVRYRSYVRPDGICLDALPDASDRVAYLASFWEDGKAALTKARPGHRVARLDYVSAPCSRTSVADLLAAHWKLESALAPSSPRVVAENLETRMALAERWWKNHARAEFALPALLGGLTALVALGLWVYGMALLWGR